MEPIFSSTEVGNSYFLPHHAIAKNISLSIKTRIVFDASAIMSSALSLNYILIENPTVKLILVSTIIFRLHQVAITTKVKKMYHQILASPQDRHLQTICY